MITFSKHQPPYEVVVYKKLLITQGNFLVQIKLPKHKLNNSYAKGDGKSPRGFNHT